MKFPRRLIPALCLVLLLSGCSSIPFTTPEEQQAALQEQEAFRQEAQANVDPLEMQKADQKLHRKLTTANGIALAEYTVALPAFSTQGQKAQSFSRINSYYKNELSGLNQDADSFFYRVRERYGKEWLSVIQSEYTYTVDIGYDLLDAPAGYLSVQMNFSIWEDTVWEEYSTAQVFLLDNGWKLTLETLLGDDYAAAAPRILESILAWCDEKNIDVSDRESRTLEEFSQDYALTTEGLVFYTQPFQMSNKNASRYRIPVVLNDLAALLD